MSRSVKNTRRVRKQENMNHNEEKNESIKTAPEIADDRISR